MSGTDLFGTVPQHLAWRATFQRHWEAYLAPMRSHADITDINPIAELTSMITRLPKCDLHCHLNGSISPSLLAHLQRLQKQCQQTAATLDTTIGVGGQESARHRHDVHGSNDEVLGSARTTPQEGTQCCPKQRMQECFEAFDEIYRVMNNLAFTRLAVQDFLFCSAAEHLVVTEVRTSLRAGLHATPQCCQRGLATSLATAPAPSSSIVAGKKMYLDTVISTVEHLLAGGVVDFESGELIPLKTAGTPLPEGGVPHGTRWWDYFTSIYGSLCPAHLRTLADGPPGGGGDACDYPTRRKALIQLWGCLQQHLQHVMHVRVLVSINRGDTLEAATHAVAVAQSCVHEQVYSFFRWCEANNTGLEASAACAQRLRHTCWVTGVDFSGNCYKGQFTAFQPALAAARTGNFTSTVGKEEDVVTAVPSRCPLPRPPAPLCVTLHGGEKRDDAELQAMMHFRPERWGHLVYTGADHRQHILLSLAGIELCLTSNLITGGHAHLHLHHLSPLLRSWWKLLDNDDASTNGEWDVGEVMAESVDDVDSHGALEASNAIEVVLEVNEHCYSATEALRRQNRYARCAFREESEREPLSALKRLLPYRGSRPLPNVSFHTDDRGVFRTSMTEELVLLWQHPGFSSTFVMDGVQTSPGAAVNREQLRVGIQALWALQRLALLQVFELPWPVLFLATGGYSCLSHESEKRTMSTCPTSSPTPSSQDSSQQRWERFVESCIAQQNGCLNDGETGGLRKRLSDWEVAWLTNCFDDFAQGHGGTP